MIEPYSGLIAGYDPGGNGNHGLAIARFERGSCTDLNIDTHRDAESILQALEGAGEISALGIDTLAAWSTGLSGWRQADCWLRDKYGETQLSVVSPNSLYGSMALNGMAVLSSLRRVNPGIQVTETHPKVLYWALAQSAYSYANDANTMDYRLSEWLGAEVNTANDHEWDASVSVLAAFKGVTGEWCHNLFEERTDRTGRLLFPAGPVQYWWPE